MVHYCCHSGFQFQAKYTCGSLFSACKQKFEYHNQQVFPNHLESLTQQSPRTSQTSIEGCKMFLKGFYFFSAAVPFNFFLPPSEWQSLKIFTSSPATKCFIVRSYTPLFFAPPTYLPIIVMGRLANQSGGTMFQLPSIWNPWTYEAHWVICLHVLLHCFRDDGHTKWIYHLKTLTMRFRNPANYFKPGRVHNYFLDKNIA